MTEQKRVRKVKVGIDVGGTFTHAVAVDIRDLSLVGKACVPTTHTAREGVARGVIDSLKHLLAENDIIQDEIALIAHSTTQATNALLEGDVASVGIIAMGQGLEGMRARSETRLDDLELAPGKVLPVFHRFVDTGKTELTTALARTLIQELQSEGAEVIVASEVFGVDQPDREQLVVAQARELGLLATAASDISKLYGLRVRTRTAVINASMMPRMLETANLTEEAIRESGITIPVMVMRSDGGIMSIDEMRRRPILTMLSGPAAGVAAALMFARVSDGIFVEVGGTSSDISVIRNGKPAIKSAQIGGHRLYVQTLDVRTLGIAGGSMPRFQNGKIVAMGPRSAHIAALAYPAFSETDDFSQAKITTLQPRSGDPDDYLKLELDSQNFTLTPTEAAYELGLINMQGHGAANQAGLHSALERVGQQSGQSAHDLAESILALAAQKMSPTLKQLMREYKLEADLVQLVGGGGGAMALVPYTAKMLGFDHVIAEHAEVISAIGAALGLIRDSVERNLINPSHEDLVHLRQEAYDSVLAMGAAQASIEVSVEVDTRNKKVVAIATGASELRSSEESSIELSPEKIKELAASSLKCMPAEVFLLAQSVGLSVYGFELEKKMFLGIIKQKQLNIRVLDTKGTVRLQLNNAHCEPTALNEIRKRLPVLIEALTTFGDAGGLVPDLYLLLGQRIIDLTGLIDQGQILALIDQETQHAKPDEPAVLLARRKS